MMASPELVLTQPVLQQQFLRTFLQYLKMGATLVSANTLASASHIPNDGLAKAAIKKLLEGELVQRDEDGFYSLTVRGVKAACNMC